jgi:lanthanide-dependent methanol dehydrogenase
MAPAADKSCEQRTGVGRRLCFPGRPFSSPRLLSLAIGCLLLVCCGRRPEHAAQVQTDQSNPSSRSSPHSSSSQVSGRPDDGQWVMATKDFANTRYSTLDQVNAGNVNQLKLAWSFSTGLVRGHEAAPLVVGSTMYVVTPFPNYLYALDLSKLGAPMKWKYDPRPASAAQGVACCDVVNRGAAYANGRIFYNTLDNHTVAVDANSGKEIWKTKLGEINKGESMTMAPLIVKNKVIVGNSGGEFGVRGWLAALDVGTGQIAWRAYSTGPDADCLTGCRRTISAERIWTRCSIIWRV